MWAAAVCCYTWLAVRVSPTRARTHRHGRHRKLCHLSQPHARADAPLDAHHHQEHPHVAEDSTTGARSVLAGASSSAAIPIAAPAGHIFRTTRHDA